MKKLLQSLVLTLVLSSTTQAAVQVSNLLTNGVANIFSSPVALLSVQVANATGVTATVRLFDDSNTVLTNIIGSYSIPVSYTTNYVTTFTNINGVVTDITNAALYTLSTTVAQSTNWSTTLNLITIPPNTTLTWQPVNGSWTSYGVTATNDAVVTMTTTYVPVR